MIAMKRRTAKEKELADNVYLHRAWKRWHREQLEEALAGVHRDVLERLLVQLKHLHSALELVDFIRAQDWSAVDVDTRLICLHQINVAICALRERNGLPFVDDPLPGAPENAFRLIQKIMSSFPSHAGKNTEESVR